MKKAFTILFLFCLFIVSFGQAPQGINYQAVIRDISGNILANQNVGLKINIRAGGASGNIAYAETHSAITNAYGLVNLVIGQGNAQTGSFNGINWGVNSHFAEIQADITGGTSYQTIGNQQLMSVPYALYAEKTGQTYTAGNGISINGNTISNTNPDQAVSLTGTGGTSVTGTYPNFTVNSQVATTYTAGTGININGSTITNTAPNQNQTLSLNGNQLSISGGNTVTLLNTNSNILLRQVTHTGFYMNSDEIGAMTATTDGSVLFVALSIPGGNPNNTWGSGIVRMEKDVNGYYHVTHFLPASNFTGQEVNSMVVIGNYLYISYFINNAVGGVKRADINNIGNLVNMTFNPTTPSAIYAISTDGTNLLLQTANTNTSNNNWISYQTISTALINNNQNFSFLISGSGLGIGQWAFFDGFNYWVYTSSGLAKFDLNKVFVSQSTFTANTQTIANFSSTHFVTGELLLYAIYQSSTSTTPSPTIITQTALKP